MSDTDSYISQQQIGSCNSKWWCAAEVVEKKLTQGFRDTSKGNDVCKSIDKHLKLFTEQKETVMTTLTVRTEISTSSKETNQLQQCEED